MFPSQFGFICLCQRILDGYPTTSIEHLKELLNKLALFHPLAEETIDLISPSIASLHHQEPAVIDEMSGSHLYLRFTRSYLKLLHLLSKPSESVHKHFANVVLVVFLFDCIFLHIFFHEEDE